MACWPRLRVARLGRDRDRGITSNATSGVGGGNGLIAGRHERDAAGKGMHAIVPAASRRKRVIGRQ